MNRSCGLLLFSLYQNVHLHTGPTQMEQLYYPRIVHPVHLVIAR